jgi:putative salt-induced outer membrane protein YdiY
MKKLLLFAIASLTCLVSNAQVLNTEKLRIEAQENTWEGNLDASFNLAQSKTGQSLVLNFDGQLGYTRKQSKWMFLTGYNRRTFSKTNVLGNDVSLFNHFQYTHLRYNYNWKKRWTIEAFVQEQFDQVHEIDIRGLGGTGLRLELLNTDSTNLYLGTLYMYEYEKNSPLDSVVHNNDHRMSTYISGGFKVKDYLTINNIVYYQPNLLAFNDFRILLETSISVRLTQKLLLKTAFNLIYDSKPPNTVPTTRFNLTNGFSFVF